MAVEDMDPRNMRRTPAWKRGWDDANAGRDHQPGVMDHYLYTEGYRACQAASGVDLTEAVQHEPAVAFDPVKIPGHYNSGTIEVTNFIADQQLDFPRGNVVKYVSRAGKKDPATEVQDLEKAAAYLQMAHNLANGKPAVVRDPETKEVVWSLFKN